MNELAKRQAQEEQRPPEERPSDKRKLFYLFFPLLVAVNALVSHYLITHFLVPPPQVAVVETEEEPVREEEGLGIYVIKDLIVNPADTRGTRFFLVSLGLEYSPRNAEDRLMRQEPRIRDKLITVLSEKTLSQLADIRYRESLREELRRAVEESSDRVRISQVYFVKYVLQ